MRYTIRFVGVICDLATDAAPPPDDLEEFMDVVVRGLENLHAEDVDVSTNLSSAEVMVSVSVEAADLDEAQSTGNSQIRASFHAAGAHTPGWTIGWTSVSATLDEEPGDRDSADLIDA